MGIYVLESWRGGVSDYSDKGISGAFKFGTNLDIRKQVDSLTCNQDLIDEGLFGSRTTFHISCNPITCLV